MKREEITKQEFEEMYISFIRGLDKKQKLAYNTLENVVDAYKVYISDSETNIIRYYIEDGQLIYEKIPRNPIGF